MPTFVEQLFPCGHQRPGSSDQCTMQRGHGGWHRCEDARALPTLWPDRAPDMPCGYLGCARHQDHEGPHEGVSGEAL